MENRELYENFKGYSRDTRELSSFFIQACMVGDLKTAEYLVLSHDLEQHADISYCSCNGFQWACKNGHIDIVKFLLTDSRLVSHVNIHADDDAGLRFACEEGNLELVKYLLTSRELGEHANVHAWDDICFRTACSDNDFDLIHFLIFDINIEKTSIIEDFLSKNILASAEMERRIGKIQKLFELKSLNDKLTLELELGINKTKKIKV